MKNLLVIGARTGSIGEAVCRSANDYLPEQWNVWTAGVEGEDYLLPLDNPLTDTRMIEDVMEFPWHAVVCTAGINQEGTLGEDAFTLADTLRSFMINTLGPLAVLEAWLNYWRRNEDMGDATNLHFAVLSSNSARVVRSTSLPYCSSKAALSMGIQCVARSVAARDQRVSVYGYEPGWVEGTPMSEEVRKRLTDTTPVSRTPGGRTVNRDELASLIVGNLERGNAMNGSLLRLDGGEA